MPLSAVSEAQNVAVDASPAPIAVLKFGSSVLRSLDDLPRAAGEIYRHRRAGWQVVAVVSALAGETDTLFAQAQRAAGGVACAGVAELVSLGEERSAALLRIACDRIGLPAEICRPESLDLLTVGEPLDARPVALDETGLRARLDRTGLVIIPGFVGLCPEGGRKLLGRGGSDLSALFLGHSLGADRVRLYKDVAGVYDRDPAVIREPRRFTEISWQDAARVAGKLIQPAAIEHAAHHGLAFEVTEIGGATATRVGAATGAAEPVAARRPLRIALAGYGVVGQALAARLATEPDFEIVAILVRDLGRSRIVPPPCPLSDDADTFLAAPADILVDALSCDRTGETLSRHRLASGGHVVSASKRVISRAAATLAAAGPGALLYSAAVGGGAPVLETIARARASGEVREIAAVLNGTVNFILDRLAAGTSFEDALEEARRAGFAEEDCSCDLSGADAAAKLRLVANAALGLDPADVDVATEPLDAALADRIRASGERWLQIARLDAGGAAVTLQPQAEGQGLPSFRDEWNGARIRLDDGRVIDCIGRGAGGAPTAEAIVADLFEIHEAVCR